MRLLRPFLPLFVLIPAIAAPIAIPIHVTEQGPNYFLTGAAYETSASPLTTTIYLSGPNGVRPITINSLGFWDVMQSTALIGEAFVAVFQGSGDIQHILAAHYNDQSFEFLAKPPFANSILFSSYDRSTELLWAGVLVNGAATRTPHSFNLPYVQAVPEPGAGWLAIVGLSGIFAGRVRRARAR